MTKKLEDRYKALSREYNRVQEKMFHYTEYATNCSGKPATPKELHALREELFEEMSTLWRQLPHEKDGLDKWL